jgi:hypothetical protein
MGECFRYNILLQSTYQTQTDSTIRPVKICDIKWCLVKCHQEQNIYSVDGKAEVD